MTESSLYSSCLNGFWEIRCTYLCSSIGKIFVCFLSIFYFIFNFWSLHMIYIGISFSCLSCLILSRSVTWYLTLIWGEVLCYYCFEYWFFPFLSFIFSGILLCICYPSVVIPQFLDIIFFLKVFFFTLFSFGSVCCHILKLR
jgi:hypothetical protein